jgi:aminocarboxymuconate-semialdehyde decarboxylase
MSVIDVHAHWFAPEWVELLEREAGANGAKMGKNEKGVSTIAIPGVALVSSFPPDMMDLDYMVRAMDEAGIDLLLFSLTNPMINWAPADFGARLARTFNDACAAAYEKYPLRFRGAMTLPMQAPERAVRELKRAAELPGVCAVYMAMHVNGTNLDDKAFWPVYSECEALGLPLCLHPVNPCGIERMKLYHMRNLVGNPHEAAIAAADLIFGGVLDAFPRLEVVLPHAGGSFPQIMRFLIEMVGIDRIVVGSDYNMDAGYPRPVAFVDRIPGLSGRERKQILEENAARLLRLS